ncbi:MAG: hypothetical protein RL199_917 [Pseudomonadota bacterium]|jgi:hypothetical protein
MLSACGEGAPADDLAGPASKVDAGLVEAVTAGETLVSVDLAETAADLRRWPTPGTRYRALKELIRSSLRHERFSLERDFPHLPVFAARLDGPQALAALASRAGVAHVHGVREVQPATAPATSVAFIRQDRAVEAAGEAFLGAGTFVAVLDTGLDHAGQRTPADTLPTAELPAARAGAFGSCVAGAVDAEGGRSFTGTGCRIDYVRDFAPSDGAADDDGHGTNVAGVVARVAPGTRLIGLDVFRRTTQGPSANSLDVTAAIDWAVGERTRYNADAAAGRHIAALNMSLGSGKFGKPCGTASDPFALPIRTARAAGILSAVASGNNGYAGALASPACVPEALSVGAVLWTTAQAGTSYPGAGRCTDGAAPADTPSCFSNTAPFLTMLAPGVAITAAGITDQGTSQATPHVAGAIAALAGAIAERRDSAGWAEAKADAVAARLTRGAPVVYDKRNKLSFPRLDLLSAAVGASTSGTVWTNKVNQGVAAPLSLTADGYGPRFTSWAVTATPGTAAFAAAPWNDLASAAGTVSVTSAPTISVPPKTASGTLLPLLGALRSAEGEAVYARGAVLGVDLASPVTGRVSVTATGKPRELSVAWSDFRDPLSGIAKYRVFAGLAKAPKCGDATTPAAVELGPEAAARTFSNLGAEDGVPQSFWVCAVDAAGNSSAMASATGASKPEADGPTGTATLGTGTPILNTKKAAVEIVAADESDTDDDSGVDFFCVAPAAASSCANWVALTSRAAPKATSPFVRTVTLPDGPVTLWLKDKWGNSTKLDPHDALSPTNAVVDTTAPREGVLTAARQSPADTTVRFTLTGWSDATTGIVSLLVAEDAAKAPASCAGGQQKSLVGGPYNTLGITYTGTLALGSARSYRVCAVDAYGNVSKGKTVTVR